MHKIMFVCHGNICRSPMAEFIMKDIVIKNGVEKDFFIASSATTNDEIGHDVHNGTKQVLRGHNVNYYKRKAVKYTLDDYNNYDYTIVMDEENISGLREILPYDNLDKVFKLMSFVGEERDVLDPWYTGDFYAAFDDIYKGCEGLFNYIMNK